MTPHTRTIGDYCATTPSCSLDPHSHRRGDVLLFPTVSSFRRMLLHKIGQRYIDVMHSTHQHQRRQHRFGMATFSIGDESVRAVIISVSASSSVPCLHAGDFIIKPHALPPPKSYYSSSSSSTSSSSTSSSTRPKGQSDAKVTAWSPSQSAARESTSLPSTVLAEPARKERRV